MSIAAVVSFSLICVTLAFHFAALRLISIQLPASDQHKPYVVLFAVAAVFLAHLTEIGVYALAYDWLSGAAAVGGLVGQETVHFMDYFYYSTVMYTSLSFLPANRGPHSFSATSKLFTPSLI